MQVVDKGGRPLRAALEGANGLKPLSQVVISGTVGPRPNEKVLVVNADWIFVAPKPLFVHEPLATKKQPAGKQPAGKQPVVASKTVTLHVEGMT